MTRLTLAAIVLLLATDSAWACHQFSIWKFPQPQRCQVTALGPKSGFRSRARINVSLIVPQPSAALPARPVSPTPEIPLPSLSGIDWGHALDDDEARGRLMLRCLLRKEDQ